MFITFNLKYTKSYVARATAEFAANKVAAAAGMEKPRCVIAEQDGRFVPIFLIAPEDGCRVGFLAQAGFYCTN